MTDQSNQDQKQSSQSSTVQPNQEKTKQSSGKKSRKSKHMLTKNEIKEIIENQTPQKEIVSKYKTTDGLANKLIRFLRSNTFYPIDEYSSIPPAYFYPKTLQENIEASLYDMGYKIEKKK